MIDTVDLAQFLAGGCYLLAAEEGNSDFSLRLAKMLADGCYGLLALNFLWGLYFVIISFMRVRKLGFRSPKQQNEFIEQLMALLNKGQYAEAEEMCDGDQRALPQLAHLVIVNREIGAEPLRQLVLEVLQRDILADLERITGWVATTIKSGPLLGLFGTVLGMMAAFGQIGTGKKVETSTIAAEISIALVCTAMGLATAIPFNYLLANINARVGRVRDSLSAGLVRVLYHFQDRPVVGRERSHA